MPTRFNNTGGFGGFGGPAPNPFIRYPGGTVTEDDVGQARDAMMFGGSDGGPPRAVIPTTTPAPARTGGDPSGSGIVNRNLFRRDNRANTEFWEAPQRRATNQPHQAVTVDDSTRGDARMATRETIGGGLEATVEHPSVGGRSPMFADESDSWIGRDPGEPTVQLPTATLNQSAGNLDAEPSLFDNWWREPFTAGIDAGASVASTNTGGGIWTGDETLSNFSNLALGDDLNASLDSLGYGQGYPAVESDAPDSPFASMADGTGIPVEPDTLNQDVGDLEWTTREDDRRFLPGNEPAEPEPTPARSVVDTGIGNIRNFGGNLTLGAFLNMPLSNMHYGEGYPPVEPGRVILGGLDTGAQGVISPEEMQWYRDRGITPPPTSTGTDTSVHDNAANPPAAENPYGQPGDFNAWPRGELLSPPPPAGMHIVGHDTVNGQPIYEDEQGNQFVNPGTGTPVVPPHSIREGQYYDWGSNSVRNLHEIPTARTPSSDNPGRGQTSLSFNAGMNERMAGQGAFAGSYRYQADEPRNFSIGGMRLDAEGGFEQVSFGRVGQDRRLDSPATRAWARALQAASTRRAPWPSNAPAPGGGG